MSAVSPKTAGKTPREGDDEPAKEAKKKQKAGSSSDAPKVTSGAKAQAAGAEAITPSPTPRPERTSDGLVLAHWNVGGLNGLLKSEERRMLLTNFVAAEAPDLLAISEHKLSEEKLAAAEKDVSALLSGYQAHWAVSTAKKGYSGVVVFVKGGVSVASVETDAVGSLGEGRTLTIELEHCYTVAAYVPNSGQKLERLEHRIKTWDPALRGYLQRLEEKKPVVLYGDLNVAHLDADIWNVSAKHIPKSAGCTPQERESFSETLAAGLVDCFRHLHPDATGSFSYWSTRSGNQHLNRGLRLDYAIASSSLTTEAGPLVLHDCLSLKEYAPNGDHAPTVVAFRKV